LTVVFAPVGATLHAMSHLRPPPNAAAMDIRAAKDVSRRPDDGSVEAAVPAPGINAGLADVAPPPGDRHGATAHCHVCDEWQFLDHVLPSAALVDTAATPAPALRTVPPVMRVFAETPWILPRAPPVH
jgi:hypothetical protein